MIATHDDSAKLIPRNIKAQICAAPLCCSVITVVRMLNFVIIKTATLNMADFGDREMILANFQVT
jgi:hypothetical protein